MQFVRLKRKWSRWMSTQTIAATMKTCLSSLQSSQDSRLRKRASNLSMTQWKMIKRISQGAVKVTIRRRWTIRTSSVRARRRRRILRFEKLIRLSWRRQLRMTTRTWKCTSTSTNTVICMCTTRLFLDPIPCALSGCPHGKAKSLT